MTREETVRNLLSELIDMIDNGSQRDLDRADEISKSILEIIEKEPCCNCIEFKRYAKEMGFEIEQKPILDKISTEIEELYSYVEFDEDLKTSFNMIRLEEVQRVIDKFKAESGDEE